MLIFKETAEESRTVYLQVLPPHIYGSKGELHLFPSSVFVTFVGDLDEDEEDTSNNATSNQHEHT